MITALLEIQFVPYEKLETINKNKNGLSTYTRG